MFALYDRLATGMIGLDEYFRVQALNDSAARLLGRQAHTAQGHYLTWLLPGLNGDLLHNFQQQIPPTQQAFSLRHHHRTLAGRLLPLAVPNDGITMLLSLFDAGPYQLADETRTHLLRIILHDMANPINIALNLAQMLEEGVLSSAEADESLTIIVKQLSKMNDLLQDIAVTDQAMEKDISRSFEAVHLDVLSASIISDLAARASQKQIILRLNPLPETLHAIQGNERLLRQAIHNLVENAIKYTLPTGWVRVTVRQHPRWTDVLVADNGIGVPPAAQKRLFAPFFRIKDSRVAHVKGSGLGLNLVLMIAQQHGGSVQLYSVPDRGSIFVFRLPVVSS